MNNLQQFLKVLRKYEYMFLWQSYAHVCIQKLSVFLTYFDKE